MEETMEADGQMQKKLWKNRLSNWQAVEYRQLLTIMFLIWGLGE